MTDKPEELVRHSKGRSYEGSLRLLKRESSDMPDYVAYPENEEQISAVLDFASTNNVAVVPYGGGSSVCRGVDTGVGEDYSGVISLDMTNLNKILEIDKVSRAARVQGGILGPARARVCRRTGWYWGQRASLAC